MDFQQEPGRIYAENSEGRLVAEITFPTGTDGVAVLNHTFVDPSLQGQGAADQLVRAAVAQIRAEGGRVAVTCSYAKGWFEKHPEEASLLAQ